MGNILAGLLSAKQPNFSITIDKLEKSSGNPSMDVRLIGEIIQVVKLKTSQVGLDSSDCTGRELYYALEARAKIHDKHLVSHIGASDNAGSDKLTTAIKKVIDKSKINKGVWAVKKSVIKKILQQNPPQRVMKYLNYTSVDSMTKRENLAEIMGAARFMESGAWLTRFNKAYKKLTPSDFENSKIEIFAMPSSRWQGLSEELYKSGKHSFTHLKEMGYIVLFPVPEGKTQGYTLLTLPLSLHYINEIRSYSAFFKVRQVRPGFGKLVADTLNSDNIYDTQISGSKIHWRIVQRHYGRPEQEIHPEVFQPHLQPEDLHWRKAEENLYIINPELAFWRGLDYVGVVLKGSDKPVSFNLLDIAMNNYFALDYKDRIYRHLQASLWNELYTRYLGHKVFENQVLGQLSTASNDDAFEF